MPELDPVYYEAVDNVVERRKDGAEWDPDEMRAALLEVGRGETQSDAAEDRGFNQGVLSRRVNEVEEEVEEIEDEFEEGSGLFRDPIEEAVEEFEDFFEKMNEKYDMGVGTRVIQMMKDEIRDAGQLPAPVFVDKFLRETKSGVSGADVDYIRRRYENWAENFQQQQRGGPEAMGGMSGFGGQDIERRGDSPDNMGGGIPIGGSSGGTPSMGGGGGVGWQQGQSTGRNDRIDRLERKVETLVDELSDDGGSANDQQTIKIEQEDGRMVEVPMNSPMAMQMLNDDDGGDDLLETLQKAKKAGLIVGPDQLQEEAGADEQLAEKIGQAIESMGQRQVQAQQQMSENFSEAISKIREMQEEEEDELTLEDVENVIDKKLSKDETERLREEMDEKFSEVVERIESRRRTEPAEQDPEFLKTDREIEFREKQLEALNENLQNLPRELAMSVQEGLVPAMKQLQSSSGSPFWSPPGEQARGEPQYAPGGVPDQHQQRQQQQQQRQQQRRQQQQRQQDNAGYPEREGEGSGQEEQQMGQQQPESTTERDAQAIRDKLGLDDDREDAEEVPAQ